MEEGFYLDLSDDELTRLRDSQAWIRVYYCPLPEDISFKPSLRFDGTMKTVGHVHSFDKVYIFLAPDLKRLKEISVIVRQSVISANLDEKKIKKARF